VFLCSRCCALADTWLIRKEKKADIFGLTLAFYPPTSNWDSSYFYKYFKDR
jgi:hypothetical protein